MVGLPTDTIAPLESERTWFAHVYGWMGVGLAVTGAVAAAVGHSQSALRVLVTGGGGFVYIGLVIIEFVLVAGLVGLVQHMQVFEAALTFLAYAALNGVTLSIIFAIFTPQSIFVTFLVTAGMFAGLAVVGYTTKVDMTSWGTFLGMALWGLILGLVVNLFWANNALYWATTAGGVVIFSAFTAFDAQRLKKYETADGMAVEKQAIVGALALYLDFVNLFLYVLRLFGRRR
jgi:FtsH-binding integral membrane protein